LGELFFFHIQSPPFFILFFSFLVTENIWSQDCDESDDEMRFAWLCTRIISCTIVSRPFTFLWSVRLFNCLLYHRCSFYIQMLEKYSPMSHRWSFQLDTALLTVQPQYNSFALKRRRKLLFYFRS
jgi:hypothetical protein